MAGVSNGSVGGLPGHLLKLPAPCDCDDHPGVPAYRRVQGETDSFGCEYHDLCEECVNKVRSQKIEGACDYCHADSEDLRHFRDYDEGSCGPVYRLCAPCITEAYDRINEEWEENHNDDRYLDEDFYR